METTLIAQTQNRNYHLLGASGQMAVNAYQQLNQYLRRKLTPEHAALLAEPNFDAERGSIDWYTSIDGNIRRLSDLDPTERAQAEQRLGQLVSDIQSEIGSLQASPRDSDRLIGEMLALALEIPSLDQVYVIGDQPVLVAWGHARTSTDSRGGVLTGFTRPKRPPPPFIHPPAALFFGIPRTAWLAALITFLILLLLLPLLLWLFWDPLLARLQVAAPECRISPDNLALVQEIEIEKRKEIDLTREVNGAWAELAAKRRECAPIIKKSAAPEPPPADVARAIKFGGKTGQAQIVLAWDNLNDLDLQVYCPDNSTRIYFSNPKACGGELDVDFNRKRFGAQAVENIFWEQKPPSGHYRIAVGHAGRASGQGNATPSDYRVTLRIVGQPDKSFTGHIDPNKRDDNVGEFTVE